MSEQDQLIADYFDGKLSQEETEALKQKFLNDPDFQSNLIDLTITERLLKTLCDSEDHALEIRETLRLEKQASPIAPFIRDSLQSQEKSRGFKKVRDFMLIAASIVIVIFGWQQIQLNAPSNFNSALMVSQSIGATWEGNHPNHGELGPGEWKLKSGILKLISKDGSKFILEGPANFIIGKNQDWKLNSGRVYADMQSDDKSKFKLQTPHAEFSDLGQKFAMEVLPGNATHLQMLEGAGAWNSDGSRGTLPVKQWVSFSKGALANKLPHSDYRFLSSLPLTNIKDYTVHQWSFDRLVNDNQFPDMVSDRSQPSYPATWKEIGDTPTGPVRVNGQFGNGIQLNGKTQFLKTDWEGISGTNARTVCFWVKVPKNFHKSQGYGIVTWGTHNNPGGTFQVSINPDNRFGDEFIGRIRIGVYDGEAIGSTDLRDQRWHHCAVVMYDGEDANTNTHFILYVDGQVEQTRGRPYPIDTKIDTKNAVKVQFGRNHNSSGFFRGWLDEVSIIDKALEDWEVRSMMKYNRIIEEDQNLTL
jgi:hypothetical protein